MGREITPSDIIAEGQQISLDKLVSTTEALSICNVSLYKLLNHMSRRATMDSYMVGGTRFLMRAEVEALRDELDAERATEAKEPQAAAA